jgi:hypothetical protein
MRIIHEKPNKEFLEKYRDVLPDGVNMEAYSVTEYEFHWYEWKWWALRWYQFVIWFCKLIVEEPKSEDKIKFE